MTYKKDDDNDWKQFRALLVAEDVTIYVYTSPNTSVLLLTWKILGNEQIVVGCGSIKSKCFHRQ